MEWPSTGAGLSVTESITAKTSRMSDSHEYSAERWLSPCPRWSKDTTRQPASARSGANRSKVAAKSSPPCKQNMGGEAGSPHSYTASSTPCASRNRVTSGRLAPGNVTAGAVGMWSAD